MATFPSLTPSSRALSYGDYPQLTYQGISGGNVRFKFGSDRVAQRLTLDYQYLTESEMQQLLDHYDGQQGSLVSFALPAAVWAGYTTVPVSAVNYEWRYAGPFQVSVASPLRYSTSIELESVPI